MIRPDILGDDARLAAYEDGLIKDYENRSKNIGDPSGLVYIHASKTPADNYDALRIEIEQKHGIRCPRFEDMQTGGLIGKAMFEPPEYEPSTPSKWFSGPVGYPIFSAEPIRFIQCRGALGFFNLPADLKVG